jgi:RHS repeat-associated protein
MPGTLYEGDNYRFGAQGSEVDKEMDGTRNWITTYYRNANLKTMRWSSPDPKANASWSPYAMMNGNPVLFNDPLGDWIKSRVTRKARKQLGLKKGDTPEKVEQVFRDEYGIELKTEERKFLGIKIGYKLVADLEASESLYDETTGTSTTSGLKVSESARYDWLKELYPSNKSAGSIEFGWGGGMVAQMKVFGGEISPGGTAVIDLSIVNDDYSMKDINYGDVPVRTINLARIMEHEYLGHVIGRVPDFPYSWSDQKWRTHAAFYPGGAASIVNKYRSQISLPERWNYGYTFKTMNSDFIIFKTNLGVFNSIHYKSRQK